MTCPIVLISCYPCTIFLTLILCNTRCLVASKSPLVLRPHSLSIWTLAFEDVVSLHEHLPQSWTCLHNNTHWSILWLWFPGKVMSDMVSKQSFESSMTSHEVLYSITKYFSMDPLAESGLFLLWRPSPTLWELGVTWRNVKMAKIAYLSSHPYLPCLVLHKQPWHPLSALITLYFQ